LYSFSTFIAYLQHSIIAALIVTFLIPFNATAWQILDAHRIADGAVSLSDGPGGLWTVYDGDEDERIRIIDAESGDVRGRVNSPHEFCFGLTRSGRSVWFAGSDNIYLLDDRGGVEREIDSPYEIMHGLALVDGGLWTMALDSGVYYFALFEPGGDEISRFSTEIRNPVGISWDGSFLWVTDKIDGFIHVFDPESEEEVDLFPTPFSQPTGITHIDDDIFLIDSGDEDDSDVLYQIDPSGENAPRLLPFSRNYNFGRSVLNSPLERLLPLFNIGNETLRIDSVKLANGDNRFSLGRLPGNNRVNPGQRYDVTLTFTPNIYNHFYDTLVVYSNDPTEPVMELNITGLGIFNSRRLGVYPDSLDFGSVRADPWRDGNRKMKIAIFNKGNDELIIEALEHRIEDIFELEFDDMPQRLQTAESLWVNVSFTPHRGITYLDTLLIYSNELRRINRKIIRGTGSDSIYAAGSVMWTHELENGNGSTGGISIMSDLNGDEIQEIVAVGPLGTAYCINGFASGIADMYWAQDFRNYVFAPTGIESKGVIVANSDLNADGTADAIIGSGENDRSVYALDGLDGGLIWHWDSHSIGAEGAIIKVESSDDYNGDSANDPVVLISAENDGTRKLVRINGANGRPVWIANPGQASTVNPIEDIDRDGVNEYLTTGDDNKIRIYSGVDGGLMEEIDSPPGGQMIVIEDLNNDEEKDLIFGEADGSLSGWSIEDDGEIWSVGQMGGVQLTGPISNLHIIHNDINNDNVFEVVATDGSELIFCFDPLTGEEIWTIQVDGLMMMIPISDTDIDSVADIAVGFSNGSINCYSGQDGSMLWEYAGQEDSEIIEMLAFDDVDLGGTGELVVLFSDRIVRCISTGGDLVAIRDEDKFYLLTSKGLISLHPNPFNGMARINFSITDASDIGLNIWDSNGRLIKNIELGFYQVGSHQYLLKEFSSLNMSAGLYYFEIASKTETLVKSGILLK